MSRSAKNNSVKGQKSKKGMKSSLVHPKIKRQGLVEKDSLKSIVGNWTIPVVLFIGITLLVYVTHSFWDYEWKSDKFEFLKTIFTTDAEQIRESIGSFIELLAALLGIMITVVAIVLQLAAQRYGTRLIDLFLADKINRTYFILLVSSLLYAIFIVFAIKNDFFPFYATETLLALTVIEIALLGPYFLYVFKFLTPTNLLNSIQENSKTSIINLIVKKNFSQIAKYQSEIANSLSQVTDTALSANSQMDRNLGLMAINQIREMALDYIDQKRKLPKPWFKISSDHFIGISSEFHAEICDKKLWVEAKSLMDMELIFKTCIRNMPDAISALAFNTRILGEEAIKKGDDDLLDMVIQFYNTFLRISLNDSNIRAMFNLYYQYRLLTESVLIYDIERGKRILFYFKYYGQEGLQKGLWFVLYNAAFDMGTIISNAHERNVEDIKDLLLIFLQIEDVVDKKKDMLALMGVRKAQLILATYLLSKNETELVKMVVEDLKNEPLSLLIKWRDMLLSVKDKKFWEVTDRGINFEYIDETQKGFLKVFYDDYILSQKEQFKAE